MVLLSKIRQSTFLKTVKVFNCHPNLNQSVHPDVLFLFQALLTLDTSKSFCGKYGSFMESLIKSQFKNVTLGSNKGKMQRQLFVSANSPP